MKLYTYICREREKEGERERERERGRMEEREERKRGEGRGCNKIEYTCAALRLLRQSVCVFNKSPRPDPEQGRKGKTARERERV